jgi:hypothetical protein
LIEDNDTIKNLTEPIKIEENATLDIDEIS